MSLNLNIKSVSDSPGADMHLLGLNIEHTGDAKVAEFFKTAIRKRDENIGNGNGAYNEVDI